jgi:hypothetical protein
MRMTGTVVILDAARRAPRAALRSSTPSSHDTASLHPSHPSAARHFSLSSAAM